MYLLNYHLRDAKAFSNVSYKFAETAQLDKILPGTRLHTGLIIVLVLIVLAHYFMYRTKWGYELRMTGANREFAGYSGMKTAKVIILVHLIAGFIAGMGGSVEVLGMYNRFQWTALPGYGLDGALVAMLAKIIPLRHWCRTLSGLHSYWCGSNGSFVRCALRDDLHYSSGHYFADLCRAILEILEESHVVEGGQAA